MRRKPVQHLSNTPEDPVVRACARARKARRRGETRDEANALRLACALREGDATLWTLFGYALLRMGRVEEAMEAWGQALWLRERAGEELRARVMRQLLDAAKGLATGAAKAA